MEKQVDVPLTLDKLMANTVFIIDLNVYGVHAGLFLTFIWLAKGVSVHVTAHPCKIFLSSRAN